jgi:hypothetical protein
MVQQIQIQLSAETLTELKQMGYALYVMRAFDTTNAAGKPLVWVETTQYLQNNTLSFDAVYEAYVSTSQVIPNGVVTMASSAPVELGQTVTVDANGVLSVTTTGTPGAVTIVNNAGSPFTTGLAAAANGGNSAPVFAEPLFGNMEDIAVPLPQFLLTFSTQGVQVGTLIPHAMAQSVLVDMSSIDQATVGFDMNTGWNAGGAAWAKMVPAGADLTPVLVHEKPMARQTA